ncbi:tricorn protease [Granulicella rosea]|uniref:Tricorn protease homolog n=1 Tax=Granulicella rosea TaxID=474952 RepID=A0A239LJS0_9BACT|nr:S41 family peptidase [Granulicella rosea]SNT30836.1 tricorn protease [Granulicella rosea]
MFRGTTLRRTISLFAFCLAVPVSLLAAGKDLAAHRGFYSFPAVHGDTVVFTSEGDLWSVPLAGGAARRLTSGSGLERHATISPDGQTVAFTAQYEGPAEAYTLPILGGVPRRRTWNGDAIPDGWTPDGRLIVSTSRYATLPDAQLVLLGEHGEQETVPLATGSEAAYSTDGKSLFFTRFEKQFSYTKRYQGGWPETIWRFDGHSEAVPLTGDFAGTSHNPMFWNGRVYFLSDRDGVMNVYSMDPQGKGVKQESHQHGFDIASASVSDGHIVYACGADLWSLDLATGKEAIIPITLLSDFEQLREHWVKKPTDYLTSVHLSPDGGSAVFTARGEVFTLPAKSSGRTVRIAADSAVRFRSARFLPDGKSILALSTQTDETEFWKYPANGQGKPEQWTKDADVLRWDGVSSPDGRWLAHTDKKQQLWVFDTKSKTEKLIAKSANDDFSNLSWSPDSRWLAFVEAGDNQFQQARVLNVETGAITAITSDRYNSSDPVWSTDGKWLYFLSDRMLKTSVQSPWGSRQPDPHFDRSVKIYQLALQPDQRSPFLPYDELHPESKDKKDEDKKDDKKKETEKKAAAGDAKAADAVKDADKEKDDKAKDKKVAEVKIDFAGLAARLTEVPAPSGNFRSLQITDKRLCWLSSPDESEPRAQLQCLDIANKGDEADTVMSGVRSFEISADRKKMLIRKEENFYIFDADVKGSGAGDPKAQAKAQIDLSHWTFAVDPREEFKGLFNDAWRLERDYFYDPHMNGVDWKAMRVRYAPLVDRVSTREELNDVISQMVSELSALHTFVRGGDARMPSDKIDLATLGARLRRDERAGGFVVEHIYLHDPDRPDTAPPFARPESLVKEGEVIVGIDGADALSVSDERDLLRGKAGQQVMLRVKPVAGEIREVLVRPVSARAEFDMRYNDWEYSRRVTVESASASHIGYVHLRAMGPPDIEQWAREFDPIYNRQGLIIDVRHNDGGNIDSWLLGKLLRQAWFYWQPRTGNPTWNMQEAFRGHVVVLCDQETASDGEAFTEGVKRLKIGTVIGTRTWGGEIWLSANNRQADGGIATAAEMAVYGPEGKWLIEGHGVDPDVVVDNLPHASFAGEDKQLQSAIELLKKQIAADPRPVPPPPAYPDKSFKY